MLQALARATMIFGAPVSEDETTINTTTEIHDLQITVIEGTLRITGRSFDGSTLQVSPKCPVLIRIHDSEGHYAYLDELPPRGQRADPWGRNTTKGLARRIYEEVASESVHVAYAIGKTDGSLAYGPIIKIKPKGG